MSAKGYREFADECMGWAKTARSDQERQIFLQMARTWLWAAARLDSDTRLPFPGYANARLSMACLSVYFWRALSKVGCGLRGEPLAIVDGRRAVISRDPPVARCVRVKR